MVEVKLKDGSEHSGDLWMWRPREGWFQLIDDDAAPIYLRDCASVVDRNQRINKHGDTDDVDLLAKARREGWNGQ